MNIHELDSYDLSDAVRFNSELNPALWGQDEHLDPQVRDQLLLIAEDFREFLGVPEINVKDVLLYGSNAAYSYTPNSDIDLHLVLDIPELDDDVYLELFNAKKYQYNDQHDIKIHGYDVELYAEPAGKPARSAGIYSVLNNDWVQVPRPIKSDIDDASVQSKYQDLGTRIEQAIQDQDLERMSKLLEKLKAMRKTGLETSGEFGPENLTYKLLRNQKLLDKLFRAINQARDAELSLLEKKPSQPVRYGFRHHHNINDEIQSFAKYASKQLGLKQVPEIKIIDDETVGSDMETFGRYTNETQTIELQVQNRHPIDVFRTLAHELVHHKQNLQGRLDHDSGRTGSPEENEAHSKAGVIMRHFDRTNPEYFQREPIDETASGYIPTARQARDRRYLTALTGDVKPGQIGKEANKLALDVDSQGHPGLLARDLINQYRTISEGFEVGKFIDLTKNYPKYRSLVGRIRGLNPRGHVIIELVSVDPDRGDPKIAVGKSLTIAPNYIRNAPTLDEDWRSKLAGAALGTAAAFGVPSPTSHDVAALKQSQAQAQQMMKRAAESPRYFLELAARGAGLVGTELQAFIAQMAHETKNFKHMTELGSPGYFVKYEPEFRKDKKTKKLIIDPTTKKPKNFNAKATRLGNTEPGDGERFKGRGFIHLTGRDNYQKAGQYLNKTGALKTPNDLVNNPELAARPDIAAKIAIWYWQKRVAPRVQDFGNVKAVTKTINPGLKGLQHRQQQFRATSSDETLREIEQQLYDQLHEDQIDEIKMAPGTLKKQAAGIKVALAGMEFEMIAPESFDFDDEEEEWSDEEPDFDQDEDVGDFDDVRNFFSGGENSSRNVRTLMNRLETEYEEDQEWQDQHMLSEWNGLKDGYVEEWLEDNMRDQFENEAKENLSDKEDVSDEEFDSEVSRLMDEEKERILLGKNQAVFDEIFSQFVDDTTENMDPDEWKAQWLQENYTTMKDIYDNYDHLVYWPYMTEPELISSGDSSGKERLDQIAQSFSAAVGRPVNWSTNYHGARREPGKYAIEPDSSLETANHVIVGADGKKYKTFIADNTKEQNRFLERWLDYARTQPDFVDQEYKVERYFPDGFGLEFIAPPLPVDEMLGDLTKVKKWAKENGYTTNRTTGLHINVSIPEKDFQNLDYVKLALLLGDKYVLQTFSREFNSYAKSSFEDLAKKARLNPKTAKQVLDSLKTGISQAALKSLMNGNPGKYFSIHPKEGYIEFRSAGEDWLELNYNNIEKTLNRFVVALNSALRPNKNRKEYMSKLAKLVKSDDSPQRMDKFTALWKDLLPKFLKNEIDREHVVKTIQAFQRQYGGSDSGDMMVYSITRKNDPRGLQIISSNPKDALERARKEYTDWLRAPESDFTITAIRPYKEPQTVKDDPDKYAAPDGGPHQWMVYDRSNPELQIGQFSSYGGIHTAVSDQAFYNYLEAQDLTADRDRFDYRLRNVNVMTIRPAGPSQPAWTDPGGTSSTGSYMVISSSTALPLGQYDTEEQAMTAAREWANQRNERVLVRHGLGTRNVEPGEPPRRQDGSMTAPESDPDANYAIIRSSDDAVIVYFTRNTRAEAERSFTQWLASIGITGDRAHPYYLIAIRPGVSSLASGSSEFSGEWAIRDQEGRILHTFGGVGNVQQDANYHALRWLTQNGYGHTTEVTVEPIMRDRSS